MDIQATEWVNVNSKFSDGEKTGMFARKEKEKRRKKRALFVTQFLFSLWYSV